jgi:hypothetical protein
LVLVVLEAAAAGVQDQPPGGVAGGPVALHARADQVQAVVRVDVLVNAQTEEERAVLRGAAPAQLLENGLLRIPTRLVSDGQQICFLQPFEVEPLLLVGVLGAVRRLRGDGVPVVTTAWSPSSVDDLPRWPSGS